MRFKVTRKRIFDDTVIEEHVHDLETLLTHILNELANKAEKDWTTLSSTLSVEEVK